VGSDGVDRHYLIVSGAAASGKTLVARGLSDELGWPIFAKDTIKAALMSVLPVADVDDARRLGRAAVEVLLAVAAEVTGGAVLEAVWRRDQGRDEVSSLPGAVVEVFCRCDRPTLEARYAARRRSAGYVPNTKTPQSYGVLRPSSPWPAGGRSSRSIPLARSIPSPSPTK
jgi:predicted kinase